ncbi:MAG: PQQ-binding-like beta-propeller repeat protein [Acidobacteriota bacterium]
MLNRPRGIKFVSDRAVRFYATAFLLVLLVSLTMSRAPAQKTADEVAVSVKCWDYDTESAPQSGLVSDAANLYFAASGGRIAAIDAMTGKSAWNAELGGQAISNILVHGPDIIAVTAAIGDGGKLGSASLRSLSKETGIVNWTVPLAASDGYFLGTTSDGIIAVSNGGRIELFSFKDGGSIWKRPETGPLAARPQIDAKYVILPVRSGRTYVFSALNGSAVSNIESTADVETQAKVSDKWVVSGDSRGNLMSRDLVTGKRQWKFKAGAKWSYIGGTKYGIAAVSADNFIYMLSPDRGGVLWKRRLPGRISGSPTFSDSYVVLASYGENSAYVIDLQSGRIVNQITLTENNSFTGSPILISDVSVAAVTNSGISLWNFGPCGSNKKAVLIAPPR